MKGLSAAESAALQYASLEPGQRDEFLNGFHRDALEHLKVEWVQDLARLDKQQIATISYEFGKLPQAVSGEETFWGRIAALHGEDGILDPGARALIESKNPSPFAAGGLAMSKCAVENPMLRQIRKIQRTISEDTARNEYQLHPILHQWLADTAMPKDLNQLNALVYARLFLTPEWDPWLGLAPMDTFTGLQNGGLTLKGR
jgi:hypothetical protein